MKIKKCFRCGVYTLKENCRVCGLATISPYPPRFSPEDKWGEWRRKAKMKKEEENRVQKAE